MPKFVTAAAVYAERGVHHMRENQVKDLARFVWIAIGQHVQ